MEDFAVECCLDLKGFFGQLLSGFLRRKLERDSVPWPLMLEQLEPVDCSRNDPDQVE